MERFFSNKYPISIGYDKEGKPDRIEAGTVFTIIGISGNMFELEPITKIPRLGFPVMVDAQVLALGFTCTDHIS